MATCYSKTDYYCSHDANRNGLCTASSRLIDAHFNFIRQVTLTALDCVETVFHCVLPKGCEHSEYNYSDSNLCCRDDMCCDIPEPCWMPKFVGENCCEICEGGKATITVWLTNNDFRSQNYRFEQRGDKLGIVNISPSSLTLGPKERTKVTITFEAPANPSHITHAKYDLLIWIDSCRDYYFRWVLHTVKKPKHCCLEITVNDVPDYVVHWYDHFYCQRPCTCE